MLNIVTPRQSKSLIVTLTMQLCKLLKLIVVTYLASILFISSIQAKSVEPSKTLVDKPFTKVLFLNAKQMRQFAISYHHALLEINYEKLYAIAEVNKKEKEQLKALGFVMESAKDWTDRFNRFQTSRLKNSLNKTNATSIPGFSCYATVEETLQQGSDLAQNYSNLAEWIDIGDSWNKVNKSTGFDLMVLKITNKNIVGEKPKLFIQSSMHAREYTPAALTLEFAHRLLEDYQTDADTRWIVDYHEVHILFQMNPDGRKIAETNVLQRKNTNENHCATGKVGVDLNRNFAHFWNYTNGSGSSGNDCDETYRGIGPESEPETQAVSNYIRSIFPDVRGELDTDPAPTNASGMHLDIHSYSELVLWPYGHKVGASPNDSGFVALGNKLAWFNDYTPIQSVGLYATDGTSDDVSYGELGVAALTFELGTSFFQDCTTYKNTIEPDNLKAFYYAAKASAMPYLLPKGPEVSSISLNGIENGITVSKGTEINLVAILNTNRTKLSASDRTITKAEYSLDAPIWLDSTNKIEFTGNDGNLSSEQEAFNIIIDTSSLSDGEHILYVRGYNENQQVGVPKAIFIAIGENNSPTPEFTFSCTDLTCDFDANQSADSDGTIESYTWDFGDGNTASAAISQNIYTVAGDHNVVLTITDNSNNESSISKQVSVTEPVVPEVEETSSSSGSGSANWDLLIMLMFLMSYRLAFRRSSLVSIPEGGEFFKTSK